MKLTDFHKNGCYDVQAPAAASAQQQLDNIMDLCHPSLHMKQHKESLEVNVKMLIPKNPPAKRHFHKSQQSSRFQRDADCKTIHVAVMRN